MRDNPIFAFKRLLIECGHFAKTLLLRGAFNSSRFLSCILRMAPLNKVLNNVLLFLPYLKMFL